MNKWTVLAAATILSMTMSTARAELADMPGGEYALDTAHGYITFSYSHFGFSNPQVGFRDFAVALHLDDENISNSSVAVGIDATSVDSRVERFNGHLTGEKFFNTELHPSIKFRSTKIVQTGPTTFDVTGDLTIKDITKSVTLNAVINRAANHPRSNTPIIGVDASTQVNRSDFDMGAVIPYVTDEVTITISVEMVKVSEQED